MKKNILLKPLLVSVALLGLTGAARAADPVPAAGTMGLLGENYAGLTYRYADLGNTSAHGDDFRLEFNQAINAGLDGLFAYDWAENGGAARQQALTAGLREFSTAYAWGKPFA